MAVVGRDWARLFDLRRRSARAAFDNRSILVGSACVAVAVVARLLFEQLFQSVVPFILTFPVVIVGTLLAGAGAGVIALVGCQLLTLLYVLPHWIRDSGGRPQEAANLALATASLALAVWATASYRRLASTLRFQCEREVDTLSLFITEMDHRTKNNFQIAASLLSTQSIGSDRAEVREQLDLAANRLVSIAAVYQKLSRRAAGDGAVPLRAHLEQVCAALQGGMLARDVTLDVSGEEVEVDAPTALTVGLVVNEWVTNAVKHAFPEGRGHIRVGVATAAKTLRVEVADDGVGAARTGADGLGSRLMNNLVDALHGTADVRNEQGTVCRLEVPR